MKGRDPSLKVTGHPLLGNLPSGSLEMGVKREKGTARACLGSMMSVSSREDPSTAMQTQLSIAPMEPGQGHSRQWGLGGRSLAL